PGRAAAAPSPSAPLRSRRRPAAARRTSAYASAHRQIAPRSLPPAPAQPAARTGGSSRLLRTALGASRAGRGALHPARSSAMLAHFVAGPGRIAPRRAPRSIRRVPQQSARSRRRGAPQRSRTAAEEHAGAKAGGGHRDDDEEDLAERALGRAEEGEAPDEEDAEGREQRAHPRAGAGREGAQLGAQEQHVDAD